MSGKISLMRVSVFRWLFASFTLSTVSAEVTALLVPLIATLDLGAGPAQMGLLGALALAPTFLLSLPAGVVVDRLHRRRRFLMFMDMIKAGILLAIPILSLTSALSMPALYATAFLLGTCTLFKESAHATYLLHVIPRGDLLEANAKLHVSYSLGDAGGPGIAGILAQILTAPIAALVGALGHAVSALLLLRMPSPNSPTTPNPHHEACEQYSSGLAAEAMEGLKMLLRHPLLGSWSKWGAVSVVFLGAFQAQYVYFATNRLSLDPMAIGAIAVVGALGALPAAQVITTIADRFGAGRTIIVGLAISYLAMLMVPLAGLPAANLVVVLSVLFIGRVVQTFAMTVSNVQQWTLRQMVTPEAFLARVSTAFGLLIGGALTFGSLLGGVVAGSIDASVAMAGFSLAAALSLLPLLGGTLWQMRDFPGGPYR